MEWSRSWTYDRRMGSDRPPIWRLLREAVEAEVGEEEEADGTWCL